MKRKTRPRSRKRTRILLAANIVVAAASITILILSMLHNRPLIVFVAGALPLFSSILTITNCRRELKQKQ